MIKGIDISCWNDNIDYQKLKNQGIEFVIIRSGFRKRQKPERQTI